MKGKERKRSNMAIRIVSGIIFALVMMGLVWAGGLVCTIGFFLISRIAFRELLDVFDVKKGKDERMHYYRLIGRLSLDCYYLMLMADLDHMYLMFDLVLFFIMMMGVFILNFPKHRFEDVVHTIVAYFYCILLSFVPLTRSLRVPGEKGMYIFGFYAVWMILVSAWASDTCAYFVGVAIGKHKAFPTLSPKKSWEGCIGGLIGSAVCGLLYGLVINNTGHGEIGHPLVFMGLGLFGSLMGQIGDLVASGIKRTYEIKDFGDLIPGHGGIMDRFDSVAFIAPMVYMINYVILNRFLH